VIRFSAPLLAILSLSGCAAPTMYSWGGYQELIYESYAEPGALPPETQILKLEEDYQKAQATHKRVPPGWHAHLGYLYAQTGKLDQAETSLLAEKSAYPESTVMVDTLLANLRRQ
jgi:hypothetical protein